MPVPQTESGHHGLTGDHAEGGVGRDRSAVLQRYDGQERTGGQRQPDDLTASQRPEPPGHDGGHEHTERCQHQPQRDDLHAAILAEKPPKVSRISRQDVRFRRRIRGEWNYRPRKPRLRPWTPSTAR
jgi:hypothetical protein